MNHNPAFIKNQIFLGCPWRIVRPKYEKIFDLFSKKYPLSFVIIGRDSNQDAEDLLNVIKDRLSKSSYAIFDATGGNANVSLEFGFAEAANIPHALYVSEHRRAKKSDSSIISDLAGKRRTIYKNEKSLRSHLDRFCKNHNYTKQFESMLRKEMKNSAKGQKKKFRTLCLKIIRQFDHAESVRRANLIENIKGQYIVYNESEIDKALKLLGKNRLLLITAGRYSSIQIG